MVRTLDDGMEPVQSSTEHICSSIEAVTKNDNCPNPSTFSIIDEYNKKDTTWKVDFKVEFFFLFDFIDLKNKRILSTKRFFNKHQ